MFSTENILYYYVVLFGLYGMIFAPYVGAKIISKTEGRERFWFYILVFANLYVFLWVIVCPSYRESMTRPDKMKISFLILGYVVIFSLIFFLK